MFALRPYQQQAVSTVYNHLREHDNNPCVVIPTGGGKTPVIATLCKDAVNQWNGRVLILAHVKELLEQAVEKLNVVAPEMWNQIGVYSAGLKSRDTEHPIIVAGIQSVYKRAGDLDAFDLIIIDEAHMIPPDGDGMYRTFLQDARLVNPNVRVIGLTATPFRMKSGMICEPQNILNHVCFEIGVKELIVDGYLCPLITKAGKEKVDTSGLHVRGGEFIAGEAEELMDTDELVEAACTEIIQQNRNRKSCLVFATGVKHGKHIAEVLQKKTGAEVGTVFGDTMSFMRDQTLEDFKNGELKYLVNVNVLTMGFDAPNIDCVAMVRPTMSPGLYYQMVGRGFRLHPGKEDCLVLDFGGNVIRHGPVDQIRIQTIETRGEGAAPAKECPQCQALVATGFAVCPHCGFVFPEPESKTHDAEASTEGILSGEVSIDEYEVQDVYYAVHTKRDAKDDAPKTLRVEYRVGWQQYHSEWVCFEHSGWARQKAESWWRLRSNAPFPNTAAEAVAMADQGALCETKSITVRSATGDQYDRIIGYEHGDKPEWNNDAMVDSEPDYCMADDEIPF